MRRLKWISFVGLMAIVIGVGLCFLFETSWPLWVAVSMAFLALSYTLGYAEPILLSEDEIWKLIPPPIDHVAQSRQTVLNRAVGALYHCKDSVDYDDELNALMEAYERWLER